jgi:23S rRNA (uridine2552-2'-O)-methyltransferase
MGKIASGRRWLKQHAADPYVKSARAAGYRSRAALKLLQVNAQERLLHPGMTVVDLGAAPGGWSQVVSAIVGRGGRVVSVDVLPMEPIANVAFVRGDICDETVFTSLLDMLRGSKADLVISDIAPNISGIKTVDHLCALRLAGLVSEIAGRVLKPNGDLLVKLFQGQGFEEFFKGLRSSYRTVHRRKPKASRGRSREIYILARSYYAG